MNDMHLHLFLDAKLFGHKLHLFLVRPVNWFIDFFYKKKIKNENKGILQSQQSAGIRK